MAVEKKYPAQFPVVATQTQYDLLREAAERGKISMASLIRGMVDAEFGLVDGERPKAKRGRSAEQG